MWILLMAIKHVQWHCGDKGAIRVDFKRIGVSKKSMCISVAFKLGHPKTFQGTNFQVLSFI